ncbi:MAG: F0F1 ATP synthase subunit B [bacterium]|nr:F0F1 ATP synthase subunit B [bacterium]
MTDLFSKLGIDWKLLAAQLVNFTILIVILYKLLYKPMLDMFQKRRNTISRSLKEAKKIEEDFKNLEQAKDLEMREARVQSKDLVNKATLAAEEEKSRILVQTKTASDKLVGEAKGIIRREKEQMLKDLEKETGGLAVLLVEKFFKKNMTKDEQEKIAKDIVSAM